MKITWVRKNSTLTTYAPWQSYDLVFDGEEQFTDWVIRYYRENTWSKWAVTGIGKELQEYNSLKEAKAVLLAQLALEGKL